MGPKNQSVGGKLLNRFSSAGPMDIGREGRGGGVSMSLFDFHASRLLLTRSLVVGQLIGLLAEEFEESLSSIETLSNQHFLTCLTRLRVNVVRYR